MENAFLETWEINFEFMNFTEQASIITPIVSRDDPPPPPPGLKESLKVSSIKVTSHQLREKIAAVQWEERSNVAVVFTQ